MLPYRDLNSYLKERFGERVQRVPLDTGFTCPNRDGATGSSGCIYCSPRGSAAAGLSSASGVAEQLECGMEKARSKYRARKFIAYFQAYTNTYINPAELGGRSLSSVLADIYAPALQAQDVVGVAIGTRADCVSEEVVDLLLEMSRYKLVFLELGLQSSHDQTLALIGRGHDFYCFTEAVHRIDQARAQMPSQNPLTGLHLVVHIIVGLPGETRDMILETARRVAALPVQGIKIHLLHVIRGTVLEQQYQARQVNLLTHREYVDLVTDILCLLPEHLVIHRLTGEAERSELVAPLWALRKAEVIADIRDNMTRSHLSQGCLII